jgi:peptide deformylase
MNQDNNTVFGIQTFPAAVLRRKAEPVQEIDASVKGLIDGMADLMYRLDGVGLAAPQAGVSKRVIVLDVGEGLFSLVNPEIIDRQDEEETVDEGCLSLPEIRVNVHRPKSITIRGLNADGEAIVKTVDGLWARAFQHEIDHLNGVLIIDHASMVQKTLLKAKLRQFRR